MDLKGRWKLRNGKIAEIKSLIGNLWIGRVEGETLNDYWRTNCNHIGNSGYDLIMRLPEANPYIIGEK